MNRKEQVEDFFFSIGKYILKRFFCVTWSLEQDSIFSRVITCTINPIKCFILRYDELPINGR